MDANEAMKQIEEIHKVIESSNKALFSGERMMVIGILVTLIPLLEIATNGLTFGNEALKNSSLGISLIHTGFYWGFFYLVSKYMPFKRVDRTQLHPLIRQAFSVSKPFMVALFGIIFALSAIGQGQLIHPIVFILLGFLFSLWGRFSIPAVSYIAWSYIFVGIAYAYLTKFSIENLWIGFTIYNGLSYLVMGVFLRKAAEART